MDTYWAIGQFLFEPATFLPAHLINTLTIVLGHVITINDDLDRHFGMGVGELLHGIDIPFPTSRSPPFSLEKDDQARAEAGTAAEEPGIATRIAPAFHEWNTDQPFRRAVIVQACTERSRSVGDVDPGAGWLPTLWCRRWCRAWRGCGARWERTGWRGHRRG